MQVTGINSSSIDKLSQRSKQFMRTADVEDLRKRNEDYAVELRKQKRNENYAKRRFILSGTKAILTDELASIYPELRDLTLNQVTFTQDQRLALLYSIIKSSERDVLEKALIYCRKLNSTEPSVPSELFVKHGFVGILGRYCDTDKYSKIVVVLYM
jgi:hypothetical protein